MSIQTLKKLSFWQLTLVSPVVNVIYWKYRVIKIRSTLFKQHLTKRFDITKQYRWTGRQSCTTCLCRSYYNLRRNDFIHPLQLIKTSAEPNTSSKNDEKSDVRKKRKDPAGSEQKIAFIFYYLLQWHSYIWSVKFHSILHDVDLKYLRRILNGIVDKIKWLTWCIYFNVRTTLQIAYISSLLLCLVEMERFCSDLLRDFCFRMQISNKKDLFPP